MSLQAQLTHETMISIRHSFQDHMPAGLQRDFYLWSISNENPQRYNLLNAMGATQLITFSANLLNALNNGWEDTELAAYCGRVNAYFMYEIMSDDLAMGLSSLAVRDEDAETRHDMLLGFNQAMDRRLRGDLTPAAQMLQPLLPFAQSVSTQSPKLSSRVWTVAFQKYLEQYPAQSGSDLPLNVWPILVANMESCSEVMDHVAGLQIGGLVREGLVNRYNSVSQSLKVAVPLSLDKLAQIGAQTILVTPTLAYFSGVLGEALYPQPNFAALLADGILPELFFQSALQVRLFNDMGLLLTFSEGEITKVIDHLWALCYRHDGEINGIGDLIVKGTADLPALTRFQKDILHGEFNMCLHNLAYTGSIEEALSVLQENLLSFSKMYQQSRRIYTDHLAVVEQATGNSMLNQLIDGFVQFHMKMYCNAFQQVGGDYVS